MCRIIQWLAAVRLGFLNKERFCRLENKKVMLISIIIPCYRSTATLPSVVAEIQQVFSERPEYDYQIILVNDCSPDDTFGTICELCEQDKKIVGVNLSRNYGQACARMAALPFVEGECAISMDDDGQHPADGIFILADKIKEGYDMVYANFEHKNHSLFKQCGSKLFGKLMEEFGVRPKGIKFSSFFAWSRFAVDELKKYHSPTPSEGSYLMKITSRFTNVDMLHRERLAGESNYTLGRMVNMAITGLTNFTVVPLRAASILGMILAVIGFISGIFVVLRKIIYPQIAMGYTSIMAVILLLGGIILVVQGLLGEYVGRVYMMLSDMPQYTIRETRNIRRDI